MEKALCEIKGINKSFYGNQVLHDISFDVNPSEVIALAGENGAGKSTLMKIMSGAYTQDSGTVKIDGKEIPYGNPLAIQNAGLSVIYQEFSLIPYLTVAENILMRFSASQKQLTKVKWSKIYEQAGKILEDLGAGYINPKSMVYELSVADKQMVEIAKALSVKSKVLLMDEPSATLNAKETEHMFEIVNRLKDQGVGIIYVSHRLEEYFKICNKLVVLKDGQLVKQCPLDGLNKSDIISFMVGRSMDSVFVERKNEIKRDKPLLSVRGLKSEAGTHDIDLDLYAGEILGVAGLAGGGKSEMIRAICGLDGAEVKKISIEGKEVKIRNVSDAMKNGIAYLPEERKTQGMIPTMTVKENMSYAAIKRFSKGMVINGADENSNCGELIKQLRVKCTGPDQIIRKLSGGNQQKVIVGKWMLTNPKIYLMDEPTRGIDVGAKYEIYELINKFTQEGAGVIFVSSELPEILGLSDRIIVLANKTITGTLSREEATEEKIMEYAFVESTKVNEEV